MVTLRNIFIAILAQGPFLRFCRNIFNGKLLGLFHKRSHFRDNGESKIAFTTKKKAEKSAIRMERIKGIHFSVFKCVFCNGWHIGANRYQMRKNDIHNDKSAYKPE